MPMPRTFGLALACLWATGCSDCSTGERSSGLRPEEVCRSAYEQAVPEVASGLVRIRAVARAPGRRCKLALETTDRDHDAIGLSVGMRGERTRAITAALKGEAVDFVPWVAPPERLVTFAVSPVEVKHIVIDEEHREMILVAPEAQLHVLATDHLQLAAELTGWTLYGVSTARHEEAGPGASWTSLIEGAPVGRPRSVR